MPLFGLEKSTTQKYPDSGNWPPTRGWQHKLCSNRWILINIITCPRWSISTVMSDVLIIGTCYWALPWNFSAVLRMTKNPNKSTDEHDKQADKWWRADGLQCVLFFTFICCDAVKKNKNARIAYFYSVYPKYLIH